MQKVKPQNLSSEIEKYLKEYKEEIDEDVKQEATQTAKRVKDELKRISPIDRNSHRGRHYADGWAISTKSSTKDGYYSKKIWNATDYQLTHLLEFGHATKNGGHVNAQPHIRPTEDKYRVQFTENLERDIKK